MFNIYGVLIVKDGEDFSVTVRDLPEVCTFGNTHEEAIHLAQDAIHAVVCHRIQKGQNIPPASPILDGEVAIQYP